MIRTFITLLEDRSDATKEGYFDLTRRFGRISFLLRPCQVRDAHFDHALARTPILTHTCYFIQPHSASFIW